MAKTLLEIVKQRIRPGTEIRSDEWRSYRRLANLPVNPPYVHLTVNHSRNFVDPELGPDDALVDISDEDTHGLSET